MARLRLREAETTSDRLPMVCMACGEPATMHVHKNFRWYPEWTGVLILLGVFPFWIVAAILSKYMAVDVPFCDQHRRYFTTRLIGLIVVVTMIFVFPLLAMSVLAALSQGPASDAVAGGFCAFAGGVIVGIIVIYIIQNGAIRPKEITDRTITLIHVHDDFVRAMADMRYESEFDEEDDRPRRRREQGDWVLPADERSEKFREDARRADPPPRRNVRDEDRPHREGN